MNVATTSSPARAVERLTEAVNRHDIDALRACFVDGFVNETPVHPARSFVGADQVVRNWGLIFAAVPDLEATVVRKATEPESAWIEWEMRGTRVDGNAQLMRGVTIFGVDAGRFSWVRFYLEPVETAGPGIDEAVRRQLGQ